MMVVMMAVLLISSTAWRRTAATLWTSHAMRNAGSINTVRPQEPDSNPLPDAPTALCSGFDLCYLAEQPPGVFYGGTCKATHKCIHHELKCSKEEYVRLYLLHSNKPRK